MKYKILVISTLACVVSFSSLAKLDDLQQEIKISSSSQEADIKNNQVIFFGPVEVTQGSIKLKANELRVFSKAGNDGKILVATGKPATYTQIMADGRPAHASANTIRYELSSRTLTLTGHATLSQGGSQVTGDKIRYNIAEQKLIAESSGKDRVITIIQPESYQESSSPEPSTERKTEPKHESLPRPDAATPSNEPTSEPTSEPRPEPLAKLTNTPAENAAAIPALITEQEPK